MAKTSHLPHQGVLFINPTSGKPLAAGRLSYWLVKAIRLADPLTPHPAGHDVRKLGHSIAFARGLDPQDILKNGFWHSPNVFIHKYLISCSSSLNKFLAGGCNSAFVQYYGLTYGRLEGFFVLFLAMFGHTLTGNH